MTTLSSITDKLSDALIAAKKEYIAACVEISDSLTEEEKEQVRKVKKELEAIEDTLTFL